MGLFRDGLGRFKAAHAGDAAAEYGICDAVDALIQTRALLVWAVPCAEPVTGVTYPEDVPRVQAALRQRAATTEHRWRSHRYVSVVRRLSGFEAGELDGLVRERLKEVYGRGCGDGMAVTYGIARCRAAPLSRHSRRAPSTSSARAVCPVRTLTTGP